jgi:hypothetical protein
MLVSLRYIAVAISVVLHAISGLFLVSFVLFLTRRSMSSQLHPHLRAYSLSSYSTFFLPLSSFRLAFTLTIYPVLPTSHATTFRTAEVAVILRIAPQAIVPQAKAWSTTFPPQNPHPKAVLMTTSTHYWPHRHAHALLEIPCSPFHPLSGL